MKHDSGCDIGSVASMPPGSVSLRGSRRPLSRAPDRAEASRDADPLNGEGRPSAGHSRHLDELAALALLVDDGRSCGGRGNPSRGIAIPRSLAQNPSDARVRLEDESDAARLPREDARVDWRAAPDGLRRPENRRPSIAIHARSHPSPRPVATRNPMRACIYRVAGPREKSHASMHLTTGQSNAVTVIAVPLRRIVTEVNAQKSRHS